MSIIKLTAIPLLYLSMVLSFGSLLSGCAYQTPLLASPNDDIGVIIALKNDFNYDRAGIFTLREKQFTTALGWDVNRATEAQLKENLVIANDPRVEFIQHPSETELTKEDIIALGKKKGWEYLFLIKDGRDCIVMGAAQECYYYHSGLGIKSRSRLFGTTNFLSASVQYFIFDIAKEKKMFFTNITTTAKFDDYTFESEDNESKRFEESLKCLLARNIEYGMTLTQQQQHVFKTYNRLILLDYPHDNCITPELRKLVGGSERPLRKRQRVNQTDLLDTL